MSFWPLITVFILQYHLHEYVPTWAKILAVMCAIFGSDAPMVTLSFKRSVK